MDDGGVKKAASSADPTARRPAKRKAQALERVTLSPESVSKLEGCLTQIASRLRGVRVSKTELVNWIIEVQPSSLSGSDLAKIEARFFDELRFAEWALRELKSARVRGEKTSLQALMSAERSNLRQARAVKTKRGEAVESAHDGVVLSSASNDLVRNDAQNGREKCSLEVDKNSDFSEKNMDFGG